jgi:hypothetical protein
MIDRTDMNLAPISTAELASRIRMVVENRKRDGGIEPPPQSMFPSDPVHVWETFPWRRPRVEAGRSDRSAFSVADLVALDDTRFVVRAHHALLARDPSAAESNLWVQRVERGWPRLLVLAALRVSREGRRRAVRVRGLVPEFLLASLAFPLRRIVSWWRRG